jgi:hypothetical protein
MQTSLATRDDVVAIGRQMREQLPILATKYQQTNSGKTEYTKAIWEYFEQLRKNYGWIMSPATPPIRGRVKGEYLTDFALYDGILGNRLACESEWGDIGCIEWAFDKLRAVKADIKVFIFQWGHSRDGKLPAPIEKIFKSSLASCGHHHPGHEIYLFMQFDGEAATLFLWEPIVSGPFSDPDKINIEPVS